MPKGVPRKKEVEEVEPEVKSVLSDLAWDRDYVETRADFVKRVSTDLLIEIMKQPGMSGKRDPAQHAFDRAEQLADLLGLKD